MAINRVTDMWAWLRGQNPRAEDNQGISSGEMLAVLPDEILVNEIILRVVTQEEGGIILCRLACVCKTFNDLKNDPKILQMAKLSCTNSLSNSKRSYRDFIWRCASMGNLYAIAAVGFNYGFTVGGKESPFFIPERMAASYLLAMSLYESESTRKVSLEFLCLIMAYYDSEPVRHLHKKARHYLSMIGINRPLKHVDVSCYDCECGWWMIRQGQPLHDMENYYLFCSQKCNFRFRYEYLRVSSLSV